MDADYKSSKEAFVSGMTGSSVGHINLLSAAALSSIALHSALRTRLPASKPPSFLAEYLILVLPLLLSMTLFADSPGWLNAILLLPAGLLLLVPPRDSPGSTLPSAHPSRPSSPELSVPPPRPLSRAASGSFAKPVSQAVPPLPALTTFRAHMLLMTSLAILAVDFPVFPRSLAKCETFGVSLMDVGVGSFVFSQGVVSAIPILKDPTYLHASALPKLLNVAKKALPIIALGIVRVLLVKGTDYPEHVTEYGVHWNFFLTLALMPVLQVIAHPLIARTSVSLLGVMIAIAHQISLSWLGTGEYVLNAPRTTWLSKNKEGVFSLTGYFAIHVIGLAIGTVILPPTPNSFRRQQRAIAPGHSEDDDKHEKWAASMRSRRENDKTAVELCSYAIVFWAIMGLCHLTGLGGGTSRRLVNLPYVAWIAAYNCSFILGYILLDLFFCPKPYSKSIYSPTSKLKLAIPTGVGVREPLDNDVSSEAPALLQAFNKNGLALFLIANVATGSINLAIPTMYTSERRSMIVLVAYSYGLCAFAWWARHWRILRL